MICLYGKVMCFTGTSFGYDEGCVVCEIMFIHKMGIVLASYTYVQRWLVPLQPSQDNNGGTV